MDPLHGPVTSTDSYVTTSTDGPGRLHTTCSCSDVTKFDIHFRWPTRPGKGRRHGRQPLQLRTSRFLRSTQDSDEWGFRDRCGPGLRCNQPERRRQPGPRAEHADAPGHRRSRLAAALHAASGAGRGDQHDPGVARTAGDPPGSRRARGWILIRAGSGGPAACRPLRGHGRPRDHGRWWSLANRAVGYLRTGCNRPGSAARPGVADRVPRDRPA